MAQILSLTEAHELITEERTSGNGLALTARVYDCGVGEITALRLTSEDSLKKGGGAVRNNEEKIQMDVSTLQKSCLRAKTSIRRKILAMGADRMLTLTFRENLTDIEKAWVVFKYFCKLMRINYQDRFCYVCVPEYQKRGAVHFHVALKGFYNINIVRHFWKRAVGSLDGNVQITSPRKLLNKKSRSWNPKLLAAYLAKYISKSDSVEFNKKRYSTGGNIEIPDPMRGWVALGLPVQIFFDQILVKLTRHKATDFRSFSAYFEGYYAIT